MTFAAVAGTTQVFCWQAGAGDGYRADVSPCALS